MRKRSRVQGYQMLSTRELIAAGCHVGQDVFTQVVDDGKHTVLRVYDAETKRMVCEKPLEKLPEEKEIKRLNLWGFQDGQKGFLYMLDEEKAKQILSTEKYDTAEVGLAGDWGNTSGFIALVKGKLLINRGVFLSSDHCKPFIILHWITVEGCTRSKDFDCSKQVPAVYHDGWEEIKDK
jgi:hypothetical protein